MTDADSAEIPATEARNATGCVLFFAAAAGLALLYVGSYLFLLLDQWNGWDLVFVRLPSEVQDGLTVLYSPLIWLTFEVLEMRG